ncbi:hypothetical protein [Ktedonospora formicarum]|uniref:Uncharacterized protein n=1 Tax=Ktedonospora formicarum TaxID=2778364 RepID=A0A8J3MWY5_9CHLR|nr:hypothetical protein [Ktedonospora formicarum]GHO50860.1 hypothetical protein KSX_90230 [Ktedonospora formicarum]
MAQTMPAPQGTVDGPSRKQEIVSHLLGKYRAVDELRSSIVRVRLHIRRCRFVTRFELEDLGVTVEDHDVRQALQKLLVFGEKRLLPERYIKKLNQIESGARSSLKERAFRTELGAFVPYPNYMVCKAEMEQFRQAYFALRDEIVRNYQPIKRELLEKYDVIARDAYHRIQSTRPGLLQEPLEAFVANYCNRISAQMPTPERIQSTFAFTFLPFDEFLQFRVASDAGQEHATLESGTFVDETRRQAREQEWQREAIARDLRLQAEERLSVLDSLCTSLVSQLRSQTYNAVCDVLATLQRRASESFAPQSVTQLKHLIERIRGLNFYDDDDIGRMMMQLQAIVELSPEARKRSLSEIQAKLRAIATSCRATLLDLDEEPRSARELGLPDFPTETSVRQARATLGLDMDPALFATLHEGRTERLSGGRLMTGSLWDGVDPGSMPGLQRATARQ